MNVEVLNAWYDLNVAIQRVLTSQPSEMSSASENLDAHRRAFDQVLRKDALADI